MTQRISIEKKKKATTAPVDGARGQAQDELVWAWLCSACRAWVKITSQKERRMTGKECPICQAPMVQGEKLVSVRPIT